VVLVSDKADEQPVATAVKTLLTSLLIDLGASLYEYDEAGAEDSLPAQYVEWTLSRRFGGETRLCGGVSTVSWRLTTRVVARTSTGARALRTAVNGLERSVLTVGDYSSTPIDFETAEDIGPDEGFVSGISSWTFTL